MIVLLLKKRGAALTLCGVLLCAVFAFGGALMDSETNYIILDTREQYEFDEGHIAGAILIPYTEIEAKASSALPDKNQLILVYCRSGRRSKIAAQSLADLGYTNVQEFGGIIDWEYGVVTD